jgi:hypothetical protein
VKIIIIVERGLTAGQKANAAAVVMGQLTLNNPEIYDHTALQDLDGNRHAAIRENVVVAEAGSGQLYNLLQSIKSEKETLEQTAAAKPGSLKPLIDYVLFSKTGQNLSNSFDEYAKKISPSKTVETNITAIGLRGNFEIITRLTKKFSLVK